MLMLLANVLYLVCVGWDLGTKKIKKKKKRLKKEERNNIKRIKVK